MPVSKASAKARKASDAATRARERASREATPELKEDGVHSIWISQIFLLCLCKFCSVRSLHGTRVRSLCIGSTLQALPWQVLQCEIRL
jgi:hypothetical protein